MANLYNGERYIDPTAYQALTNIEREQRRARNAKERSDRKKAIATDFCIAEAVQCSIAAIW